MATALARSNSDGSANPSGQYARAVVVVPIADILTAPGLTNAEKRGRALLRLVAELSAAVANDGRTDAEIDQQVTDAQAKAAADKASKPRGGL